MYVYIYIKNTVISSHRKGSKWKWYDGYQHIERLAIESYGKKKQHGPAAIARGDAGFDVI